MMPGIPWAAIGAGLGQGTQQLQQQRTLALQQALQQLALQQQRQQSEAQNLLGSLPAEVFGPGGGNGALNLPGSTQYPGAGMASPAPAAPTSAPTAAPPAAPTEAQISAAPTIGSPIPLDSDSYAGETAQDLALNEGGGANSRSANVGSPASPAAAPGAASSAFPGSEPAAGMSHEAPVTNPIMQRLLGPSIDLGQVMQRIRQARPDADPGTVWRATSMLYEMMEKGNAAQMNAALRAYTQLRLGNQFDQSLAERTRHNEAGETATGERIAQGAQRIGIAQQNADTSSGRAATAADQGQQRIDIARANMQQRQAQFEARLKQASGIADQRQRYAQLGAMLRDVDGQLGQLRNAMPAPADAAAQIKALGEQRQRIVAEMNKGSGGQPLLPAPTASTPLPGGGASAPIPPPQ